VTKDYFYTNGASTSLVGQHGKAIVLRCVVNSSKCWCLTPVVFWEGDALIVRTGSAALQRPAPVSYRLSPLGTLVA
jgi:hypothetical protein